jgi:heme A synthase
MTAPRMPRAQTALALAAVIVAAGAMLPVSTGVRIACAAAASALVVALLLARLRAHRVRRSEASTGVYERIERIRAERAKRRR